MGNQDQAAYYPNDQGLSRTFPTNYRSAATGSTRQQYAPAPPGPTFKQPSHFAGKDPRESPDLCQMDPQVPYYGNPQTPYYTKQGPSGLPPPFMPPVEPLYEDDSIESNIDHFQFLGSFPSQLHSVSEVIEAKFLKLEEKDGINFDSSRNITVFGGQGVGKSEIIKHFSGVDRHLNIKALDQQYKTTGIIIYLQNKETRKIIKLNIFEANKYDASHAKVRRYKQSEVAVVVFDVSNNESLREAYYWITKIKEHTKTDSIEFILVGNKSDLSSAFITKGSDFANKMKMSYTVTCAINGLGLDGLLEHVATLAYDQSIKTDKNESRLKILEESHRTMQHDLLENFKTMQSEQRAERQQIIELQQHLDEQRKLEDARRREDQAKLQQQQNKLEEQQQMLREQQRILDDLRQQHRQPQPELQGQPQPQGLRQGLPQGQPQIQVPPQRQEQPQQKKSSSCTLL